VSESHAELIQRAGRWLTHTRKSVVVVTECTAFCASLTPDALGWTARGESTLIECKTSVSDFYRDRSKPSHRSGRLVGRERFYLTPRGLLKPELIPDPWGLLEVRGTIVRVVKPAVACETDMQFELAIILAETRRVASGWRKLHADIGLFHASEPEGAT
jgi:hypothetical protein